MRLALIGAFPFPLPQGSQVYIEGQARALARAGAEPLLITYGTQQPAIGGFAHRTTPRALSPSALRSGPSLAKPIADAALLATYVRAHRRHPFDVALAHIAEAAVVAIAARRLIGVPVVYVAHTILRHELSAYAEERWRPALDRVGRAIDTWITRRADGIIALSAHAEALLAPRAACAIAIVPPGLDPSEAPSREAQLEISRTLGLEPETFVLYAGNLDAYQELELLDQAAARCRSAGIEIVVATHHGRDGATRFPNLRIVEVASFEEMRALHFAAEILVMTRRRPGGFPVKLLNYMEAARPIVALDSIAPGLEDGRSACLLAEGAGPDELADAILGLRADRERARKIGTAGRKHLVDHHAWPELADRTLSLTRQAIEGRSTLRRRANQ